MKLGVLFSGGKDSTLAAYKVKRAGHEIKCLIAIKSKNKESFMFHTPSIDCVEAQAKAMGLLEWNRRRTSTSLTQRLGYPNPDRSGPAHKPDSATRATHLSRLRVSKGYDYYWTVKVRLYETLQRRAFYVIEKKRYN